MLISHGEEEHKRKSRRERETHIGKREFVSCKVEVPSILNKNLTLLTSVGLKIKWMVKMEPCVLLNAFQLS